MKKLIRITKMFSVLFVCYLLLIPTTLSAQSDFNEMRKQELDYIVTNLDRKTLNNLDSIHAYLHEQGENDFERVFMFYGLIAIHYKYDKERTRMSPAKLKEYPAYYTVFKKKGVCLDFAGLFKDLCTRSDIPCVLAQGRTEMSFFKRLRFERQYGLNQANHAWNFVKYDDGWHFMDPSWSRVTKTERFYSCDSKGEFHYVGMAKRADRTFFDIPEENIYSPKEKKKLDYFIDTKTYSYIKPMNKREKKKFMKQKTI